MKFNKTLIAAFVVSLSLIIPATSFAAGRTNTVWMSSGSGGVSVVPYISADKHSITIDFENVPKNAGYIYYNLNYTDKNNWVKQGIEGSFIPSASWFNGSYGGVKFIRKTFTFGTCSASRCRYHRPKDVTLTVNTQNLKLKNGQYSQVLTFPNDQFGD